MEIKKTIIALDFDSLIKVKNFFDKFDMQSPIKPYFVKIGMELFYSEGFRVIDFAKNLGLKIFLDLKIHDIPNTAYSTIKSLNKYEVDIINVHALGGKEMMTKAKEAIDKAKLIAVTHLTSTNQESLEKDLLIYTPIDRAVLHLANKAKESGLDGIVCSSLETKIIKENLGQDFLTICPGIRFDNSNTNDDQKRTNTPKQAFANGADYIVIGRPITKALEPQKELEKLNEYCS